MNSALYNKIGKTYSSTRIADPRITSILIKLLDLPENSKILDIGAGTGNYSQALAEEGFNVSALEPSEVMRNQGKKHERLTWVEGSAESVPLKEDSFDGVVMTLCMHHFTDWKKGLREACRMVENGPIVILTFDPEFESHFWLFEYFPAFLERDKKSFPKLSEIQNFSTNQLSMEYSHIRFPLPPDLKDHFAASGWARPEIYLDKKYRGGISSFSSVDEDAIKQGLRRLEEDLKTGDWNAKHGNLREKQEFDLGYTFIKIHSCQ